MNWKKKDLTRLILVDVTWSAWDPEKDEDKFNKIVNKLISDPPGAVAPTSPAYIHRCYSKNPESNSRNSLAAAGLRFESPPIAECEYPNVWTSGANRIASAANDDLPEESSNTAIDRLHDSSGLSRTSIFMRADRFHAATESSGDTDYWALVDLRFQRISQSSVLWHSSLLVWSDPPWNTHFRPYEVEPQKPKRMSEERVASLIDDFNRNAREAFRGLVSAQRHSNLNIFGRSYQPPSFLTAVPQVDRSRETAAQHHSDILAEVSNEILRTRNFGELPHAFLKGGTSAYRRFLPAGDSDRPCYLLIPDTSKANRNLHRTVESITAFKWLQVQEEALATDALILTDLEAYAASQLDGIDSRMRTREDHLRIYQVVAEQAGTLWDALARLLPDARGARLESAHRSIEMVHQTLLQGVADLDQLGRNIDGAMAHIETTADDVADKFDRELHHPSREDNGSTLRDSLRGGYIDRLRHHVAETASTAARVTDSYRMLLDTIGLAFDERRVREGDRMQRANIWLAAAFGVLGLAGVAQATLPVPVINSHEAKIVKVFLWAVALVVFVAVLYQVRKLRTAGRVVTRDFERRYKILRNFLDELSTDHLEKLKRDEQQPADDGQNSPQQWELLDKGLCDMFVDVWNTVDEPWRTEKRGSSTTRDIGTTLRAHWPMKTGDSYGIAALRSRVEIWTLRTLLLTERPRDFSRYQLPVLACIYRIYTTHEMKNWRAAEETSDPDNVFGEAELKRVLGLEKYGEFIKLERGFSVEDAKDRANLYGALVSKGFSPGTSPTPQRA
ncbi:MAG: hypothetical protein ACLPKE_04695 [Streptosporangiaceae bacterium]